ncbi:hypothetical protein CDAR_285001 [Caerostris darwini]|uniref:Ycf15 n=1 Tax=Caerostris darwini TaxID=1538125 RepID=A0AAV4NHC0_9ARAC|nr:hypothetical protein CDAR_285001 [Caerostris darwini]
MFCYLHGPPEMRRRTEGGAEGRDERKWLFSYPVIRFREWNTSGCSGAPHLTNLRLSTAPSSVREPRFDERTGPLFKNSFTLWPVLRWIPFISNHPFRE